MVRRGSKRGSRTINAELSWANRPADSRWSFLEKLEFRADALRNAQGIEKLEDLDREAAPDTRRVPVLGCRELSAGLRLCGCHEGGERDGESGDADREYGTTTRSGSFHGFSVKFQQSSCYGQRRAVAMAVRRITLQVDEMRIF